MYKKIIFALILGVALLLFPRFGKAQGYYDPNAPNGYYPYGYGYTTPYGYTSPYGYPYDNYNPYGYDPYGYYQTPPPWGYYGNHEWREHEEHERHEHNEHHHGERH